MMRERLVRDRVGEETEFRWRGQEVSRLENFTDAAFAFAMTLLVLATKVPQTFAELQAAMQGVVIFAICFSILVLIWYFHYQYFRRYGLQDGVTIVLNATLVFVVLLYVYPLKFLASVLLQSWATGSLAVTLADGSVVQAMTGADFPMLMIIYSSGYTTIFLIFTLLYAHAYAKREVLGLNAHEQHTTRLWWEVNLIQVGFGLTSIALTQVAGLHIMWSGLIYFLLGPVIGTYSYLRSRSWEKARHKV